MGNNFPGALLPAWTDKFDEVCVSQLSLIMAHLACLALLDVLDITDLRINQLTIKNTNKNMQYKSIS